MFECAQKPGNLSLRRDGPRGDRSSQLNCGIVSLRTERFLKSTRLTNPADYQEVFRSARKQADNSFLFLVKENRRSSARLGLAISKKRIQSAVQRNKVKRMIREGFRKKRTVMKNLDIVVLVQKNIDQKRIKEIKKSLSKHWEKLSQ